MGKCLFLLLFLTFQMRVCAKDGYWYQLFVKENKVWNVTYRSSEGSSNCKRTYIIKGDTIIEGKQYKKFFEGDNYVYALREDGKKIYAVASIDKYGNPNTAEELWYDFNLRVGDVIETEFSYISVTDIGYLCVKNDWNEFDVERKYFCISEYSKSHPTVHTVGLWVEGIGAYNSPNIPNGWFRDGNTATMDDCYEDGHCIFTHADFATIEERINTAIKSMYLQSTNQDDTSIYDLQGRRLIQKPQNGLYIQNGKKVMVK